MIFYRDAYYNFFFSFNYFVADFRVVYLVDDGASVAGSNVPGVQYSSVSSVNGVITAPSM